MAFKLKDVILKEDLFAFLDKKIDAILERTPTNGDLPRLETLYEICYDLLQKEKDHDYMQVLRAMIRKLPNQRDLRDVNQIMAEQL